MADSASDGVASKMTKIEKVSIQQLRSGESHYLKPFRMHFVQNKVQRSWDFMQVLDSVAILIYNRCRDVLIFVKQFRPPVYFKSGCSGLTDPSSIDWSQVPGSNGVTLELCAGVLDKPKLTPMETAREEVLEECGYDVPLETFEFVQSYRSGVGEKCSVTTFFYVEVKDSMKVNTGGGNVEEGEMIQVVEMTIPEIRAYINQKDVQSPGEFLNAVNWFLKNRWCTSK